MARTALTLLLAAGLSAWAAAQVPPSTARAGEQSRLLTANRALLDSLFRTAVEVSDSENDLKRIEACQAAAKTLADALGQACRDQKPDRAAELGDYLGELLSDGLLPAVEQARPNYRQGSPGFPRFQELDETTTKVVKDAANVIPSDGTLGTDAKVQSARGKLVEVAKGK